MRPPRKLLIQMSGAPGSGKSTIATLLSRSINGVVINHDIIKSFLLQSAIVFAQASKLTYALDWILAEDMIKQGRSVVIIDTPCNYNEILERGLALALRYGFEYRYVECRVDDLDLLDQRLRERVPLRCQVTGVHNPPPDVGSASGVEDSMALFKRWIDQPCRPDRDDNIIVDSTGSPEETLDRILKQIAPSC